MKILHIGLPIGAIIKELSTRGEYKYIDWTEWTAIPGNVVNLRKHILKVAEEMKPDFCFMHIQTANVIDVETAQTLDANCGQVINFTWDFRDPTPPWFIEIGKEIDMTVFTNQRDVDVLRCRGINAEFSLGGYDNDIFKPDGDIKEDGGEIVFMGNNYANEEINFPLTQSRIELVNRLRTKYGDRFRVYGFGWPGAQPLMHREKLEAAVYRNCKAAINYSHFEVDRYTSDRLLRIMGTGALALTHEYEGMNKDFTDGLNLVSWKNFDELELIINSIIKDYGTDGKTELIQWSAGEVARRGHALVSEKCTWKAFFDNYL